MSLFWPSTVPGGYALINDGAAASERQLTGVTMGRSHPQIGVALSGSQARRQRRAVRPRLAWPVMLTQLSRCRRCPRSPERGDYECKHRRNLRTNSVKRFSPT